MVFGAFRQLANWQEKQRLLRKLNLYQQQKQSILVKLGQTRQREDKAQIRTLDAIIAMTQKKLNQLGR